MPYTAVACCGFECGVSVVGGGGGTTLPHWGFVGAGVTFDTSTVINGLRSLRVNPSGAAVYALWNRNITGTVAVMRFYVNIASAPTSTNCFLGGVLFTSTAAGIGYKPSDGKVYLATSSGSSVTLVGTGLSVTTGVHLIDIRVNAGANPWIIDAQIDGTPLTQQSVALVAGSSFSPVCGSPFASATFDIYYDDMAASATSGDYPIGAGKVLGFVPASDGTHTSTSTHITKGTAATPVGAAITSATTDAFNWVNGRPLGGGATDATRLINQQTAAVEYVEVGIEQTSETTGPRAVEVLVVHQQAGTQACDSTIKVNDNGTENTVFAQSGSGVVTDRYATKQYAVMPADSAAWTLARFKALKLRFGYASDATPDVYWRGAIVEAEFAVATVAVETELIGSPFGASGQRQMAQLLAQ